MNTKKISDFPDGSGSLTGDDVLIFMDNPSNGGITKKITLSDLSSFVGAGFNGGNIDIIDDICDTSYVLIQNLNKDTKLIKIEDLSEAISVIDGGGVTYSGC